MESRDFEGCFGLLKEVAELYGTRLSKKRAELLFEACRELSLESFAEGVRRHIRWGSFFPAPAEVFKALYGTHEDQATMAWCDVLEAIRRTGAEDPLNSPTTASTTPSSGWAAGRTSPGPSEKRKDGR